jgi:histidine triad (HIT) family protein
VASQWTGDFERRLAAELTVADNRPMTCILCTPPAAPLFEDDICYVMLHDDRAVAGHAMVVAKQHVQNARDLDRESWLHIADVWRMAEDALLAETGRERSIVMKLGIQVPHLHIHLYPVSADADRTAVMAAIDGKVQEERDEGFEERVRARIGRLSAERQSSPEC